MWVPKSVEELESAVASGSRDETHNLEFKREPPNNKSIAREVAGLAVDGGVFIIGVGEDEAGRPTILAPFELVGWRDRVQQIVRTSIEEPPFVDVIELWKDDTTGYLVIAVPASPRAPHQVTVGRDNRFYGRSGTLTVPLEEGDVARIYQRRERWAEERDAFLEVVIQETAGDGELPAMYVGVRSLGEVDVGRDDWGNRKLTGHINRAREAVGDPYPPSFVPVAFLPRDDGTRVALSSRKQNQVLDVTLNGVVRFMSERPGDRDTEGTYWLFPPAIASKIQQVLTFAGLVYEESGYYGPTLIGFALLGAKGAAAYSDAYSGAMIGTEPHPLHTNDHRRTMQVSSQRLLDEPREVTRELSERLFYALAVLDRDNPFK